MKKGNNEPGDLESDANDGGRPAPDDLHAVAEAAVEDGHGEEGHNTAEENEHLKKEENQERKKVLRKEKKKDEHRHGGREGGRQSAD